MKKSKHEPLIKLVLIICLVVCIILLGLLARHVFTNAKNAIEDSKNQTSQIVVEQTVDHLV